MAKRLIIANWKMNPATFAEAKAIAEATKRTAARAKNTRVVICPPALYLRELSAGSRGGVSWGVQDVFYEERGAYTGEMSVAMAKNAGATFAILGHSERRRLGETDALIAKKVAAALSLKLTPILCIGEHERDTAGNYVSVIRAELTEGLSEISASDIPRVVVAYEPVWAIGKRAAEAITPTDLHEVTIFIKKVLAERLDRTHALKVRVLYGGAVEVDNVRALLQGGDVDGLLVGHASLDMKEFPLVIKAATS